MRYSYVGAWEVQGGICLADDTPEFQLGHQKSCRFVLTRNPDALMAVADRGAAVRSLMLRASLSKESSSSTSSLLDIAVEETRTQRRERLAPQTAVLIAEGQGDIDVSLPKASRQFSDFEVIVDAFDNEQVKESHRPDVDAMKVALALESDNPVSFIKLAEDTYLTGEGGKIIYSVNFKIGVVNAMVSSCLRQEQVGEISKRFAALRRVKDTGHVQRLFRQTMDSAGDRLRAFISAWAALEILIATSFKRYEREFLAPFKSAGQPNLRQRFLERVTEVMADKYRLADKFVAVSAVLFPTAPEPTINEYCETFRKIKKFRDSISHGDGFSEYDLPTDEVTTLLRRYMAAQIDMAGSRSVAE